MTFGCSAGTFPRGLGMVEVAVMQHHLAQPEAVPVPTKAVPKMLNPAHRPIARAVAGGLLALSALSLSACGDTSGPEQGADVESIQEEADDAEGYEGPFDAGFHEDVNSYAGQTVTVSADVNRRLSTTSFIIAGTDDTSVEPLLIVGSDPAIPITADVTVQVTGTVMTDFDLVTVEQEMGVDLDDELYADFDGEPYIDATSVDTSVASDR